MAEVAKGFGGFGTGLADPAAGARLLQDIEKQRAAQQQQRQLVQQLPQLFPGLPQEQQRALVQLAPQVSQEQLLTQGRALASAQRSRQAAGRAQQRLQAAQQAATEKKRRFEIRQVQRQVKQLERGFEESRSPLTSQAIFLQEELPKALKAGRSASDIVKILRPSFEKRFGKGSSRNLQNRIDEALGVAGIEDPFFGARKVPEKFDPEQIVQGLSGGFAPEVQQDIQTRERNQQLIQFVKQNANSRDPEIRSRVQRALQVLRGQ